MPDPTISNTSPLFYLHRLNHLDLLRQLYQRVIVPEAVVAELKASSLKPSALLNFFPLTTALPS
jgi:predicted nucleic acid-binding protein